MPSHHAHADRDLAGVVLAHPLALQLTSETISVLEAFATSEAPEPTAAERRLLRLALQAIEAAEVAISRSAA